jgi:quercetin dioxygenase-like cupin family protein
MKQINIIVILIIILLSGNFNIKAENEKNVGLIIKNNEVKNSMTFGKGIELPEMFSKYFTGKAYLKFFLKGDSELETPIANVTFEPGCINNWHMHEIGQILISTKGRGYYQEFGKKAVELLPGDIVEIPKNVKHWHGAAKDSEFVHLVITKGKSTWLEEVSMEDYKKLK